MQADHMGLLSGGGFGVELAVKACDTLSDAGRSNLVDIGSTRALRMGHRRLMSCREDRLHCSW